MRRGATYSLVFASAGPPVRFASLSLRPLDRRQMTPSRSPKKEEKGWGNNPCLIQRAPSSSLWFGFWWARASNQGKTGTSMVPCDIERIGHPLKPTPTHPSIHPPRLPPCPGRFPADASRNAKPIRGTLAVGRRDVALPLSPVPMFLNHCFRRDLGLRGDERQC